MSFAFPLALLLLALPPLLARFLAPRIERGGAVEVPPSIAEDMGVEVLPAARRRLARLALYAAWGLAVLAIAGPRQMQTIDVPTDSGRDIVLVLDLSGSMATEDFDLDGRRVSRLEAVQAVASRFVLGRAGDRVGLVVFGDRAYVAAGLTHDVAAVAHMVATSAIGVSGESTAIADGLGLALKRLRAREAESRVVVLLSDGKDTTGVVDPGAAALKARALGIRVHTIALGPDASDADTHPGNVVDVAMLERIAASSGGEVFRVRTTPDLVAVTAAIDRLEPSPSDAPPVRAWREWWPWPAGGALVALLALLFLDRRGAA